MLIHRGGGGDKVELTTLDGETVAVVTLLTAQVRPAHKRESALKALGSKAPGSGMRSSGVRHAY